MPRLSLPERVDDTPLPPVELLDMRGLRHALHPDARRALEEVRERQKKAIVLVARRGLVSVCRLQRLRAGLDVPQLRRVADAASRRRRRSGSICHHCGHTESPPHACPDCGSTAVARHGVGTQRLEVELREALAPLPVFRLDADAGRRKGGIASVLDRFASAPAGILVGTQMVAQGHDFPDVELAVVQDADANLRFPDFRAEERTFSLVAQLAGRSGRGPGGGRVLVQTLCPSAPSLRHAASHDAAGLPRGGGRAPARAALSALLDPDQSAGRGSRPGSLPTRRPSCSGSASAVVCSAAASTCSAPRRCSASRTSAARHW